MLAQTDAAAMRPATLSPSHDTTSHARHDKTASPGRTSNMPMAALGRAIEDAINLGDPWMITALCEPDIIWHHGLSSRIGRDAVAASLDAILDPRRALKSIFSLWVDAGSRATFRLVAETPEPGNRLMRIAGFVLVQTGQGGRIAFVHSCVRHKSIDPQCRALRWSGGRRPPDHPMLIHLQL